ncbi:MAG: glycosyltransferase, partial [Planctomycetota bacterium]|nr:glycosyltransferase [Planctomycetota bacterium]
MGARGGRVLHVLSQRPMLTGSGVTLDALVREAAAAGWDQHVVCGVPAEDGRPVVGELEASHVHPLTFASAGGAEDGVLPFPVPGMSDVMPYASTTWSSMDTSQLGLYREGWRSHLSEVISFVRPDVIHVHHGWIVAGITKEVAPSVPVVVHTHGTALRQLELCPGLRDEVIEACRGADAWATLHAGQKEEYARVYGLDAASVHVVGAGYREELFHSRGAAVRTGVAYAGKLSHAKGL